MIINTMCYVVVAKIYESYGTIEEYVQAYSDKREAQQRVAEMQKSKPNNEEYIIVDVPLRIVLDF